MFSKVLIANRGEIAVRIIRACREMGIRSVAVYSQADKSSLHVKIADEAICIGEANSKESYLNIPAIISAAEIADVEAIHPGYGFLAENAHFAEVCQTCQIKFIGPDPQHIKLMGDKLKAKQLMKKAGLPLIPGSKDPISDKDQALKIAHEIGYPVIIKAAGGGGGRGMRVAHNDVRLVSALITAQTEAEAAFNDNSVYIEKYIEEPRHIEFQILADNSGRILHLGERDCSVQRRYQKLIEEAPSPGIDPKLRKKMGEMAVKGAREVNYVSAGTMEFLVDRSKNFYFMEMNTRIQVEHPVTELVTGIDIVKEQIKIAAGGKLSFQQEDIRINGWAVECRINAEDYKNNFIPSPGRIDTYIAPGGPNLRLDTHVYPGYTIPPYYDSMIAKLIAHGPDRISAIKTMQRGLEEFIIEPLNTTLDFHKMVLNDPVFLKGQADTHFIERLLGESE